MTLHAVFREALYRVRRDGTGIRLRCARHTVVLRSDTPAVLDKVGSIVGEYFWLAPLVPDVAREECEVALTVNSGLFRAVAAQAEVALHGDPTILTRMETRDGQVHYVFEDGRSELLIVSDGPGGHAEMAAVRAARAVLLLGLERSGWHYFHAACVAAGNRGIVLTGNKFSGKTTTLFNLLRSGWDFVANDKIAIGITDELPSVLGFPINLGVRDATFDVLADQLPANLRSVWIDRLATRSEQERAGSRVYFSPREIAEMFSTKIASACRLTMFVLPEYDATVRRPSLEFLEPSSAIKVLFQQHLSGLSSIEPEQAFLQRMLPGGPEPDSIAADFTKQLEMICRETPCYRLRQNERVNDRVDQLLRSLLLTARA